MVQSILFQIWDHPNCNSSISFATHSHTDFILQLVLVNFVSTQAYADCSEKVRKNNFDNAVVDIWQPWNFSCKPNKIKKESLAFVWKISQTFLTVTYHKGSKTGCNKLLHPQSSHFLVIRKYCHKKVAPARKHKGSTLLLGVPRPRDGRSTTRIY